jgi:hypothetical protein
MVSAINGFLSGAAQSTAMTPFTKQRLQTAAQRLGLRIVVDRYSKDATGQTRFLLRPYWNAKRAVRLRPDGTYELAVIWAGGRRKTATLLSLEELEAFLARWSGPSTCAPALLPWQALPTALSA